MINSQLSIKIIQKIKDKMFVSDSSLFVCVQAYTVAMEFKWLKPYIHIPNPCNNKSDPHKILMQDMD